MRRFVFGRAKVNTSFVRSAGSFSSPDAVVIGAGIVGCSTALALARKGMSVTVVDSKTGAGDGTTSYSSGCLRVFYTVPSAAHLAWESYQFFNSWRDQLQLDSSRQSMNLRETGGILLDTPACRPMLDVVRQTMKDLHIPVVELDKKAAQDRCALMGWDISRLYQPQRLSDPDFAKPLSHGEVAGACYFPTTAYVSDPRVATQDLSVAAQKIGVKFLFSQNATGILLDRGGDRVGGIGFTASSPVTKIASPIVVNCAGPHSSIVNKMAFASNPSQLNDMKVWTRALRSEVAIVDAPPGIDYDRHGVMCGDFDLGIYSRPEFGNRILIGGIEPACDPLEWIDDDPDHIDTSLGDQWEHHVHRCAIRIPHLQIPSASKRRGVVSTYDCTPDWSPIIDKSKLHGYFMNIGTSGNCFKSAPIMGDMMADVIAHVMNGGLHDSVEPMQYACKLTGGTIDTKCFSRLRNIHKGPSNVLG